MTIVALDTETELISPGNLAPRLVCVSFCVAGVASLRHHSECGLCDELRKLFEGDDVTVGANIAYDMAVLMRKFPQLTQSIFIAYEEGRIRDVQTREKLIDIADGCYRWNSPDEQGKVTPRQYSLAAIVERRLGYKLDKSENGWRLRYGELLETPLSNWPEDARRYALDDALYTLRAHDDQEERAELLEDEPRQNRAALALHLMSCRGLEVDQAAVDDLEHKTKAELVELQGSLKTAGLVRSNGTRDTKKAKTLMVSAMSAVYGELGEYEEGSGKPWKLTDGGDVCLDEEACLASEHPLLRAYARAASLKTVLDKDVPALRKAPVQARFDVLANTGRTTCSGYNVQAVRRLPGIRECFAPRPGYAFVAADFPGLELRTNAQATTLAVGASRLAEVLRSNLDPHIMVAAQLLGISDREAKARYDAGAEDMCGDGKDGRPVGARQVAKVANFGFFTGMSPRGLRKNARKTYRMKLSADQAQAAYDAYCSSWPEMQDYWDWIRSQCGAGLATVTHFGSNRVRGLIPFTVACNTFSQGLGADAAKETLWEVCKACFVGTDGLRDSYLVNFVHDEYILETPLDQIPDAADLLKEIMEETCSVWTPAAPMVNVKPVSMLHWSKKAEQVFDEEGNLVPWGE